MGDLQIIAPRGVDLQMDGEPVDRPAASRGVYISDVKTGAHQIEASLRGYRTTPFSIVVHPRQLSLLEIELADVAPAFGIGNQHSGMMLREMATIHFLSSPAEPAVGVFVDGEQVQMETVRIHASNPPLSANDVPSVLESCRAEGQMKSVEGEEACPLPPQTSCAQRYFIPRRRITVCVRTEIVRRVPLQATVPTGTRRVRFVGASGQSVDATVSLTTRGAYLRVDFASDEVENLTPAIEPDGETPSKQKKSEEPRPEKKKKSRKPLRKPVSRADSN